MTIRIVLADDHEVIRIGLKLLLEQAGMSVVAEASDGEEAYKAIKKLRPNLVLLDVRMPNVDGLKCLARVKLDFPEIPVVMFSAFDNSTYMARAVALGAAGYILKESDQKEIVSAVRAVASGDTIWSKELLRRVTGALAVPSASTITDVTLTKRESEVLKQLALGLTNKEIAVALSISYETVKEHVQHILRKLSVSDRTQAAVWAVRNKLV